MGQIVDGVDGNPIGPAVPDQVGAVLLTGPAGLDHDDLHGSTVAQDWQYDKPGPAARRVSRGRPTRATYKVA